MTEIEKREIEKSTWECTKEYNKDYNTPLEERREQFVAETIVNLATKHHKPIAHLRPIVERWKGLVVELPGWSGYVSPEEKGRTMGLFERNWREDNPLKSANNPQYAKDYSEWSNLYLRTL
ncbi:hypothetical protein M3P19_00860 [Muricauda sp. 2012CJ35-5]|uniref:Uncharacterized protein n=1 Tax=Flagellimonas spongiicola TaxID=2942208 RepID=A0ABT0PMD6_9FLAO|nr:hypothetical protein [Allomuricauda spongiicola]MCL6272535.1 hypothetical protein [Allomuricauda spongiicola]